MIVNGEKVNLSELKNPDIKSLLQLMNVTQERVAIEHNEMIIKKSEIENILLKEDDKIEIIHFVGGGN